jgi:hypothetical protein
MKHLFFIALAVITLAFSKAVIAAPYKLLSFQCISSDSASKTFILLSYENEKTSSSIYIDRENYFGQVLDSGLPNIAFSLYNKANKNLEGIGNMSRESLTLTFDWLHESSQRPNYNCDLIKSISSNEPFDKNSSEYLGVIFNHLDLKDDWIERLNKDYKF